MVTSTAVKEWRSMDAAELGLDGRTKKVSKTHSGPLTKSFDFIRQLTVGKALPSIPTCAAMTGCLYEGEGVVGS